jgi:hypothetical protein
LFLAARYIEQLRAQTRIDDAPIHGEAVEALASPRLLVRGRDASEFLRRIGYLWCGAMLDTRVDTLLLPVLARVAELEVPLPALLRRRSLEFGWGLPDDFFEERLASGACLVLLDGLEAGPGRVAGAVAAYPLNRYIVASGADCRDSGAGEDRFDFGGLEARCVVIDGEAV